MSRALEDQHIDVIDRPFQEGPLRIEPTERRVRALVDGVAVADSKRALLMLEEGHLPVYYLPLDDVRLDLMERTATQTHCPRKGDASYWSIRVGDRVVEDAMWAYKEPLPGAAPIKGYAAFYWNKLDEWFEEDDQVYEHARDPYHRVDVLSSSRHIRILVGGEMVAETRRPKLLFETNLPTRYYIPKTDVRLDLLRPSEKLTRCPYKGQASYYDVIVGETAHKDLVWVYEAPIPELPKIENHLAFFNEKADIYVDGELLPKPKTPWS